MSSITRKNPIPLYLQLEELLRSQIRDHILKPGDPVPTELELQSKYNLSRTTVRQAMANLERDGIINRQQGKGTFISQPRKTQPDLWVLNSFSEEIRRDGGKPGSKVLQLVEIPVPTDIAAFLDVEKDYPLILYRRIRTIDDKPVGIHTVYLNKMIIPGLDPDSLNTDNISLYDILEKDCHLKIGIADEVLESISADASIADTLGIPVGFPVMCIQRTTSTIDEIPFEHAKIFVRGDKFKYRARLKRPKGNSRK